MTFKEFILENDIPVIFKELYRKFQELGYKPISIKFLEGIYNSKDLLLDVKLKEEVEDQIYLKSASGINLDNLSSQLGFIRKPGEMDEDFRQRVLTNHLISKQGSTIKSLKEFLENTGFEVENWYKTYDYCFATDSKGNHKGAYTGQGILVAEEGWINYTFYFLMKEIPDYQDIVFLETSLDKLKKAYNRVYVR